MAQTYKIGDSFQLRLPDGRIDTVTVFAVKPRSLYVNSPLLGHSMKIFDRPQIYHTITKVHIVG
jgi:hypothetical protein